MASLSLQSLSDHHYRTDFTSPSSLALRPSALIQPAISKPLLTLVLRHYLTHCTTLHSHFISAAINATPQYTTHTHTHTHTQRNATQRFTAQHSPTQHTQYHSTPPHDTMSSSRHSSRAHSTSSAGESCAWQSKLEGSTNPHSLNVYLPRNSLTPPLTHPRQRLPPYANIFSQMHAASTRSPRPHSKSSQTEEVSRP